MRTEVCFLLSLFVTPVVGGGGQPRKSRGLLGYDKPLKVDPQDHSPCASYGLKKHCDGRSSGWHYNVYYKFCLHSDDTHCGDSSNNFQNCDQCMKTCNTIVCTSETTTKAPPKLPKISPFGR
uniref:Der and 72 secreted protein n=1 Tax=Rhipicephalus zambeziensis TaxID=60191 RepID=A0A224Y394_9ACAR